MNLLAWMCCYRLQLLLPKLPWYSRIALRPGYAICRWYCRDLPPVKIVSPKAMDALKAAYRQPQPSDWDSRIYDA